MAASLRSVPPIRREPVLGELPADDGLREHAIGHFIRQVRGLTDLEVGEILAYQRANGLRFGEAAIALKLATSDDVLWALSQQFDYPYAAGAGTSLHADLVADVLLEVVAGGVVTVEALLRGAHCEWGKVTADRGRVIGGCAWAVDSHIA